MSKKQQLPQSSQSTSSINPAAASKTQQSQGSPIVVSEERIEHHSGPLPTPETLAGYERIVSGAAERIISMAEKQSEHRQAMERESLALEGEAMRRTFREASMGQVIAFLIVLMVFGAGVWLVFLGETWGGVGLIGSISVAAIVESFVSKSKSSGD